MTDNYSKLAEAFGKSQEMEREPNLPANDAPGLPPVPAPPPINQPQAMRRRTVSVPAELLDRFDLLYARWLLQRRKVQKDEMMTRALEEYLARYEDL